MSALTEVMRWLTEPEYAEWRDPNPERSKVTSIEHALQAATLALHARGEVDDEVIVALLHDAARPLNDAFHGEVMAEVLRGRVEHTLVEALRHHGEFQADIVHGTTYTDVYRREDWWPEAQRLAVWDAHAFEFGGRHHSLDRFRLHLHRVLDR